MAKILAPNKEYNGVTASVHFAAGVGETEKPALLNWFKTHGYQVEGAEKPEEPEKPVPKK